MKKGTGTRAENLSATEPASGAVRLRGASALARRNISVALSALTWSSIGRRLERRLPALSAHFQITAIPKKMHDTRFGRFPAHLRTRM
jgi:hypothetical protein